MYLFYGPFLEQKNYQCLLCGSAIKNPLANAGDVGSIPRSGRSPGGGMATHSSILEGKIPWTENPGRPQSMGSQRVRHNEVTEHACML